jgi:hypothetical protein
MTLIYTVRHGKDEGLTLKPHRYKAGYRASKTKFGPHIHVDAEEKLVPYLQIGWFIRMSAKDHPPSGIKPESVDGWRKPSTLSKP